MSGYLLAEFSTARAVREAAATESEAGRPARDALSPVPLEGIAEHLSPPPARKPIGWAMVAAGLVGAALGWLMQWYSAVFDYPINSGGRPLNSWPAFLLVPYETTILAAGVVGLLGWMWMCGLPKLFHPLLAAPIVERSLQDRFLLVFPREEGLAPWLRTHLKPDALHEIRQ
jgi:hypothetical protein